ncbi:COX15/CtaA family protein [Jannaschia sp. Os4]|uniref:heme A synthase n=1 Tax=Jannaschia sp. Os4 TaxID=2807617 RepID=UPI00193AC161|nr:heme A synthase [Jannaschia sp. Os4]MBM2576601.1 COX15/CtaA family protein [Jannaschia sp. Os4]
MAKRAIFEEVTTTERPATNSGGIDRARRGKRGWVRAWLALLFGLVVLMVAVGGMTRLTDSGLSITEWKPLTGAIPPLSEADWQVEFELYRQIPEYQLQNSGMTLAEFKVIYWWEWGHRQLGRVIGLVWAAGLLILLAAKAVPPGWTGRLVLLGALGGLQGAIGWWMVSSGLTGTMLDVASYRLATHLTLAFVILSLIAWFLLQLARPASDLLQARRLAEPRLATWGAVLFGLTLWQVVWGALVAGIDAGLWVRDWPTMNGGLFPVGMWDLSPWWRNLTENHGTVQFLHRLFGYILVALALYAAWRARRSAHAATRGAFAAVGVMVILQMVLGIVTVLEGVPIQWAILHQFGAVVLTVLTLRARHRALYPLAQSVRTVRP